MISEALEKFSIAKNTRGWMISKGCMLSLKRLALMYKYPYILKNVVSTIENIVEEKQAARIAARENALEVLGIVWKSMSNVKLAKEIPEEDLSCIKSKTKKSIFMIANHRCIHALPNILSLIEFANFKLEKNVVVSCVEALVKYSEPPDTNDTASKMINSPKIISSLARLASFDAEDKLPCICVK